MDLQRKEDGGSKKIYDRSSCHHKDVCKWRIDNEPYDVAIRCGTSVTGAHKFVLAGVFTYFKRMFTNQFKENISSVVDLKTVHQETFTSMIDFAYTGKIEVDSSNVQYVLLAADYFVSNELKHFCEKFLIEQLGVSNAFNFRYFGQYLQLVELVGEADKLIARKFVETTFDEDFLSLGKEDFVSLVSRSDLQVKREEYVFDAVTRWINHDYMNRNQFIFDLLQQVKLAIIVPEYLTSVVLLYPACLRSNKCQQLIYQVLYSNLTVVDFDAKGVKPRGFPGGNILLFHRNQVIPYVDGAYKQRFTLESDSIWPGNAVLNGKLYRTGGIGDFDEIRNTQNFEKSVRVFSPTDKTFKLLSSMNCSRV